MHAGEGDDVTCSLSYIDLKKAKTLISLSSTTSPWQDPYSDKSTMAHYWALQWHNIARAEKQPWITGRNPGQITVLTFWYDCLESCSSCEKYIYKSVSLLCSTKFIEHFLSYCNICDTHQRQVINALLFGICVLINFAETSFKKLPHPRVFGTRLDPTKVSNWKTNYRPYTHVTAGI